MSNAHLKPDATHGPQSRRLHPVRAELRLGGSLSANERYPLTHAAATDRSATNFQLEAGMPHGDCFVVVNHLGECWDGQQWVNGWGQAVQFRRPDPAYELCEQAAGEAERRSGMAGVVCYIPPGTLPSTALVPFPNLTQVDLRDFARNPEVC